MFFIAPLVMAALAVGNADSTLTGYSASYPIAVATCSVDTQYDRSVSGGGDAAQVLPKIVGQTLNITFSNGTAKEISSVTFAVSDGANVERITDRGVFSPGVMIVHTFKTDLTDTGRTRCNVSLVAFADGSNWTSAVADDVSVK